MGCGSSKQQPEVADPSGLPPTAESQATEAPLTEAAQSAEQQKSNMRVTRGGHEHLRMMPRFSQDDYLASALERAAAEEKTEEKAKAERKRAIIAKNDDAARARIAAATVKASIEAAIQQSQPGLGQLLNKFMSLWSVVKSIQDRPTSEEGEAEEVEEEEAPKGPLTAHAFGRQVSMMKLNAMTEAQVAESRAAINTMVEDMRSCSLSTCSAELLAQLTDVSGELRRLQGDDAESGFNEFHRDNSGNRTFSNSSNSAIEPRECVVPFLTRATRAHPDRDQSATTTVSTGRRHGSCSNPARQAARLK